MKKANKTNRNRYAQAVSKQCLKRFATIKEESLQSKLKRLRFNLFPAYRRSGGRISFISGDWKEVHVRLALTWTTKNYVGSVFGGSIYAALDPIYMIQLIHILGDRFVVWDKAAHIQFIRPIKREVYARFLIADSLMEDIYKDIAERKESHTELPVVFTDKQDVIYAKVTKTIYIADKEYYNQKRNLRSVSKQPGV